MLFPLTARAAAIVGAVAPGLTADALGFIDRLLPGAGPRPTGRHSGAESQSWLSPSWLTRLGDRAARQYNQLATRRGDQTFTSTGTRPE